MLLLSGAHIGVIQVECESRRVGRRRTSRGVLVKRRELALILHRPHERGYRQRTVELLFVIASNLKQYISRFWANKAQKPNLETPPGVGVVKIISLAFEVTRQR